MKAVFANMARMILNRSTDTWFYGTAVLEIDFWGSLDSMVVRKKCQAPQICQLHSKAECESDDISSSKKRNYNMKSSLAKKV